MSLSLSPAKDDNCFGWLGAGLDWDATVPNDDTFSKTSFTVLLTSEMAPSRYKNSKNMHVTTANYYQYPNPPSCQQIQIGPDEPMTGDE